VVPRKIRQLITDLQKAGFVNSGGKGNHRNLQQVVDEWERIFEASQRPLPPVRVKPTMELV